MSPPVAFPKYLRDALYVLNKILAYPKLRIDTLKNILKFLKVVIFLVGKALKLGYSGKINLHFTFWNIFSYNATEM